MKSTRSFATIASVVCALTASLPACDGDTVTVAPAPAPAEDVSFRAGETWTGYIESFEFASGSELVTITFTTPTEGTVSFGAPPNGPQVVDPDVGFPAVELPLMNELTASSILAARAEQFAFPMRDAKRENDRMRFTIRLGEIWRSWCAAQTTTYAVRDGTNGGTIFNCIPAEVVPLPPANPSNLSATGTPGQCFFRGGTPDADGDGTPDLSFECAKANLCGVLQVCSCDATRCDLSPFWAQGPGPRLPPRYDFAVLEFDIHIDGEKADGATGLGRGFFRRQ